MLGCKGGWNPAALTAMTAGVLPSLPGFLQTAGLLFERFACFREHLHVFLVSGLCGGNAGVHLPDANRAGCSGCGAMRPLDTAPS